MRKNNPACYECQSDINRLYTWKRLIGGGAVCLKCHMRLNKLDADDCFEEIENR